MPASSASNLIFISYSRKDSKFVDRLEADLKRKNFRTWVDRQVKVGNWQKQIQDAIAACRIVLVVISPDSVDSEEVENEWTFAREENKLILPLELRSAPIPYSLRKYQRVDFQHGYEAGFQALMETLVSLPSKAPAASDAKISGAPPARRPAADSAVPTLDASTKSQADAGFPHIFMRSPRPTIALIRQDSYGEFMLRLYLGAESMAEAFGVRLMTLDAPTHGDTAVGAIRTAVTRKVDAIIIDHGSTELLKPEVRAALAAGVQVVTFDLVLDMPDVPEIEQNDILIGTMLAHQVVQDMRGQANVIYVNIDVNAPENAGSYAPLEKRDGAWQLAKRRYRGLNELTRVGIATYSTADDNEPLVAEALEKYPNAQVIVCMWDEFAKAALRALRKSKRAGQVSVYSVDIAHENIHLMREDGSPWKCAVATDARAIGRLALRTAVALLGGERPGPVIQVAPSAITRAYLLDNDIRNMDQLIQAIPSLGESPDVWYPWMKVILEQNGFSAPI